jgi:hypothetical protein
VLGGEHALQGAEQARAADDQRGVVLAGGGGELVDLSAEAELLLEIGEAVGGQPLGEHLTGAL